ncbi:hypothetical protein KDU71_14940 [Carboxylicivirga sediminis]|uniref:START domain-containing protein n=1 Tax=Carboxylicivirga sediminis TaxID=2006564 RepID=A0A941F736_9BACT|nr:hypothetical protein [Carboxylicivirga sediminis]MBR8536869.1 hypothetical protein [Carboxylicivirga sediminis]
MKHRLCKLITTCMLLLMGVAAAQATDWQLKKEKDGIRVFTKQKDGTQFYMYKVEALVKARPEEVYRQVVDFAGNLKHMELVDSIRFLNHQPDERYTNYMRLNLPWPVKNRDMVVEMGVTKNEKGYYLESTVLPDYVPINEGIIRIADFYESWTIKTGATPGESQIMVTGWVDPGGAIPAWVVKLTSVNTPYRFISGILGELAPSLSLKTQ